jgi:hypothetical protein
MRAAVFYVFLLVSAGPAMAQTTPEELRAMAYAGDIEGAEAALAQAHQQTLDGTLAYDDLRALVSILIVTHPDVVDFVEDWRTAYPDSPYAKTLQVFHMRQAAWYVRGEDSARKTHPLALETFRMLQLEGMELALSAYRDAPDYILASDAVFAHQRTTRVLSNDELLEILVDVMDITPSHGSLLRLMSVTQYNWNGGGHRVVVALCEMFADKITDVENYTPDVCSIEMIHAYPHSDEAAQYAYQLLDDHDHPLTDLVRVRRGMERQTEEDRAFILDYMSQPDFLDHEMAERFKYSFRNDDESEAVMQSLDERLIAFATEELPHDPFNPDLMKIAAHDYYILRTYRGKSDPERSKLFALRLLAISPYDASNWESAAGYLQDPDPLVNLSQADPYYTNMIFFRNHSPYSVFWFIRAKLIAYTGYIEAVERGDIAPLNDTEFQEQLLCPLARATRVLEGVCEINVEEGCSVLDNKSELYDKATNEVSDRDLCEFERTAPLQELMYTPVKVRFEGVDAGIANR